MTAGEVARSYLTALSEHNPDAVAALVTEDFKNIHTGVLGEGCTGRETYRLRLAGFFRSFPGLHYEAKQVIEQDGNVAITYEMTAQSEGKPFRIEGVMIIQVRDSLISSRTDYWDGLTFQHQVGATR